MIIFKFLQGNRPKGQKCCELCPFENLRAQGCPPLRRPLVIVSLRHQFSMSDDVCFDGQLCLKAMLHHFKLAGSSRDHWLMPRDVCITVRSHCFVAILLFARWKGKYRQTFELISCDFIMSLRIPKMRACSIQRCRKNIAEGYMREHPAFGKRSLH